MASNPTWVKRPKNPTEQVDLALHSLVDIFKSEVIKMRASFADVSVGAHSGPFDAVIAVGSSQSLPIPDKSIDLFVSSPPYCTRIDHAVATMPELALLGYEIEGNFQKLRRQLIGTSTVPALACRPSEHWGPACTSFLEQLQSHKSKASKSYYFKNHTQYFAAIFSSLAEIARTLVFRGLCVLVVQDSYYKNIHNNLPIIFIEMANAHGLELVRRKDFQQNRTMAGINPAVKRYRNNSRAIESVLCFTK